MAAPPGRPPRVQRVRQRAARPQRPFAHPSLLGAIAAAGHWPGRAQQARGRGRGRARAAMRGSSSRARSTSSAAAARSWRSWRCRAPRPRRNAAAEPLRTGGSDQHGPERPRERQQRQQVHDRQVHQPEVERAPAAGRRRASSRPSGRDGTRRTPRAPEGLRAASPAGPRPPGWARRRVGEQRRGQHHDAAAHGARTRRPRARPSGSRASSVVASAGASRPMRERAHADRGGLVPSTGASDPLRPRVTPPARTGVSGGRGRAARSRRQAQRVGRTVPRLAGWARARPSTRRRRRRRRAGARATLAPHVSRLPALPGEDEHQHARRTRASSSGRSSSSTAVPRAST